MDTASGLRAAALSSIVVAKADGRRLAYLSLDYVPAWRVRARWRYRRALKQHRAALGKVTATYIECPSHPLKVFRTRRRALSL